MSLSAPQATALLDSYVNGRISQASLTPGFEGAGTNTLDTTLNAERATLLTHNVTATNLDNYVNTRLNQLLATTRGFEYAGETVTFDTQLATLRSALITALTGH